MAERRMLHRKAAVSSDLAELRRRHGGDAVAFFHQLIPFYDRWGCVPDDVNKLRGMACPTWDDVGAKDVKRWVDWMVRRAILVRVAGPDGDRGLRNPHFEEHQRGTHFERESPSPYEPEEITKSLARTDRKGADMQGGPDQVKTRSGPGPRKGREGKGSNPSPSIPPSPIPQPAEEAPGSYGPEPPAGEESNGRADPERVDLERIKAACSPAVAAAIERAQAKT